MNIESILTHYDEPHRHYHNRKHIEYMFRIARENGLSHEIDQQGLLWYAIVYHDIVYDPTKKDNELKSSYLFQKEFFENFNELQKENIHKLMTPNYNFSNLVHSLILLTKYHTIDNGMWFDDHLQIAETLIDLDLAILGDTWEVYQEYASNVRKEYAHVTDEEWVEGRLDWIRSMLSRKSIYYTDWGKKREDQAKENLSKELFTLIPITKEWSSSHSYRHKNKYYLYREIIKEVD